MKSINKQATLNKLATLKLAINHVIRQRMVKRAYGVYDDFDYTDRIYDGVDPDDEQDSLIENLKSRIASLSQDQNQLYDAPPYAGYTPKFYVSKHRYHTNSFGWPSEVSLDKYIKMVNEAIEARNAKKLKDVANYWSIRGAITDPKAKEAITKAIEEYRKTNPEAFE